MSAKWKVTKIDSLAPSFKKPSLYSIYLQSISKYMINEGALSCYRTVQSITHPFVPAKQRGIRSRSLVRFLENACTDNISTIEAVDESILPNAYI